MSRDTSHSPLQLHAFLRTEKEAILQEWERIDQKAFGAARELSSEELRNSLPSLLDDIAKQVEDGAALKPPIREMSSESPKMHTEHRWHAGFSLEEVTREYSFLRAVILQQLALRIGDLPSEELVFLNEMLDLAIIEAVITYVESASKSLQE